MAEDKSEHPPEKSFESREHMPSRRRFLVAAASAVGTVGVVGTAIPFLAYWEPSARAQAAGAPIEVDLEKLDRGQLITVQWRAKPVWVLRRTDQQIKVLPTMGAHLRDPESKEPQQFGPPVENPYRSLKPEYFVCVAICTHLGCIPEYRPEVGDPDLGADWKGGFFCPCHGSRYDLAGRVFQGVPAPLNLPVVPYYFKSDHLVRIGELEGGAKANWSPKVW